MIALDEITVFNDIKERLALITPEQIERTTSKLSKQQSHEPSVGVIISASTKALFTLANLLSKESVLELAKARAAEHDEIEKDCNQRAALLDMLEDVARELFWTQAKIDVGFFEMTSGIGVREGWVLVKIAKAGAAEVLAGLLRGELPGMPNSGS